jgi:hypothetical protein
VSTATYRIADEPQPSPLARLAVDPIWPLLTTMVGGLLIGWVWLALNSSLIGSPSRRRELLLMAAGLITLMLLPFALWTTGDLIRDATGWTLNSYLLIAVPACKLYVTYLVYFRQSAAFEIYAAYGGASAPGFIVVLAAAFVGRPVIAAVIGILAHATGLHSGYWSLVLR